MKNNIDRSCNGVLLKRKEETKGRGGGGAMDAFVVLCLFLPKNCTLTPERAKLNLAAFRSKALARICSRQK